MQIKLEVKRLADDTGVLQNLIHVSAQHPYLAEKQLLAKMPTLGSDKNSFTYYPVIVDDEVAPNEVQLSTQLSISSGLRFNNSYTLEFVEQPAAINIHNICFMIRVKPFNPKTTHEIDASVFLNVVTSKLKNFPLAVNQTLLLPYDKLTVELKVKSIDVATQEKANPEKIFQLTGSSLIAFEAMPHLNNITLLNQPEQQNLPPVQVESLTEELPALQFLPSEFTEPETQNGNEDEPVKLNLDFNAKGIGGYHKELEQLVREAYYSRILGQYAEAYGTKPSKGILLYGPPGTGKTQLATIAAKLLPNTKVIVVNGPELKSKFVGESQENIRKLFADAEWDWLHHGKKSPLYVLILDEIDSICPVRGSRSGSTGVDDDNVAQFLTKIQGVNSPPNILIIGTTNRKDLVDPAILRPGRLEVHIKLDLPDEHSRLEILNIKTQMMRKSGLMCTDVDLENLAKLTINFTGAELEQLVNKAINYAMGSNFDFSALSNEIALKNYIKNVEQLTKVTMAHFKLALQDITPSFGVDKSIFKFDDKHFIVHNDGLKNIINDFNTAFLALLNHQEVNRLNLLLAGDGGSGKTELAKNLALLTKANYIKLITPEKLLGLSLQQQLNFLEEEFANAQQSNLSVIILDELENLLQADANFSSYSNPLRIKLQTLLKQNADNTHKCIVIATTQNKFFIKNLLKNSFDESAYVPNVPVNADTLTLIGTSLGYRVINPNENEFSIMLFLPINDLIHEIRKFTAGEPGQNQFDIPKFIPYLSQKFLDEEILLSPSEKMRAQESAPDSIKVLRQSGSPLHTQANNNQPIDAIHSFKMQ